jgi:NADH:ubiquinone oxidoreductase subunit
MNIGTKIYIFLKCKQVGTDQFGNKYYISNEKNTDKKYKRLVDYNGIIEATKVPPMWNAWLRYNTDIIPNISENYNWQKEHKVNLTGTNNAYMPLKDAIQNSTKPYDQPYESWRPKE